MRPRLNRCFLPVRPFLRLVLGLTLSPLAHAEVVPNRTVPKVDPPQTGLHFASSTPSTAEISRARVFEEPLIPIGGEPSLVENGALAAALLRYAERTSPDDFASLTDFLVQHPKSPWRATLFAGLGFEYYTTAHYSLALEAWSKALAGATEAKDTSGSIILARAAEELALLYARLGRMTELEALLKSTGWQTAPGASEKVNLAREALWMMQNRPEVSFRCGPLALQSILRSDQSLLTSAPTNAMMEIFNSASTQEGFSLPQVAELSQKIGLNYQMAFRSGLRPSPDAASPVHIDGANVGQRPSASDVAAAEDGRTPFIIPSVVHWKVGHYAALVRQEGDRYLLEDPTFGNTVWATRQALEAETSGYFLLPPGKLPQGWRAVDAQEGASVWGKGVTGANDPDVYTPEDHQVGDVCADNGMPVSSVHLMAANLSIKDTPLAYTPPVGPPVRFTFRYNSRDIYATEGTFGGYYWNGIHNTNVYGPTTPPGAGTTPPPISYYLLPSTKMTHDWISYIIDSPQSLLADVKLIVGGGGARTFKSFNNTSQTFALQEFDQTLLKRTGANSYELVRPDGSKKIFSQSNGSVGAGRRVYLTQIVDPAGNALTFTYDQSLRIVAVTDAIGQVTTLTYGGINLDNRLLTRVTDPFGRFASFDYKKYSITASNEISTGILWRPITNNNIVTIQYTPTFLIHDYYVLTNMTDMLGLSSQPDVSVVVGSLPTGGVGGSGGYISQFVTPYGTTMFNTGQGGGPSGTSRFVETTYPDGSRSRVEYNQNTNGIAHADPPALVPQGMNVFNQYLYGRNTFYWSRNAYAQGAGDYAKAKIYHWLHAPSGSTSAGILESIKEPLERRVWFGYAGQIAPYAAVGSDDQPTKIGRVLDDGSTQLYTYAYNSVGNATSSIDPIGRELSYVYATNGIDLLEVRQTRGANNELLARATYNSQHRPLTMTDAAGQATTNTYNARGQLLTTSNPKGETTIYSYDADGYLILVDGPLPGTNDVFTATYDSFGRTRTQTDESGYTLIFDYDAMDRLTRVTHPDATFSQLTYNRLDLGVAMDSAGRQTLFEYDNMRQLTKQTDPLGRVTRYEWCSCGGLGSLTDPMGRTTEWHSDVQGRPVSKKYGDGSTIRYSYENTTSRLLQVMDEKQQVTHYNYYRDNTLKSVSHINASAPTPGVSFTYDPNYRRVVAMVDGVGTTRYSYNSITGTPTLGAGDLASEDGPRANDTITYGYDELGRLVHRAINGVDLAVTIDAAGRRVSRASALGAFAYGYDGASDRIVSRSLPGSQAETRAYGNAVQDLLLQRITYTVGATPISEFIYGHDVPKSRVATWSQQAGAQAPNLFSLGYDAVNQLLSAVVTNTGALVNTFAYTYDPVGNRLTEQVGSSNYFAAYNALNQITTGSAPGNARTNEWDAQDRLVAMIAGNQRTEFTYDGLSRMASIRLVTNGVQASLRRFLWVGHRICEERDAAGVVTKRFFGQGMKVESGPHAGIYFYTRDHLSSIREITDASGNVRARYSYDPYGRRTKLSGDMDADFGFAGMFWCGEANLNLTLFRAYDPELGRWLSRDPLGSAETVQGPNLYAYVANDPVNWNDPLGLFGEDLLKGAKDISSDIDAIVDKATSSDYWLDWFSIWYTRHDYKISSLRAPRLGWLSAPVNRISTAVGSVIGAGITILTSTDCNVANGILGLVRQGKGGSVNVYQDRMLKELEEIDPTP
jgi:RHS repeat-associated protein